MFIDTAKIYIKAGDGGDGAVSFRREKYINAGGPDGGDGGKGGDIVFYIDSGLTTLMDFRYKRKYVAEKGENGSGSKCTGRNGQNLVIKVPAGTIVRDADTGRILADLTVPGESTVIAKGGKGGKGNQHFATPTRQVPNFAKSGDFGEEFNLQLELKLLADVGLVGYPNVGKSTLLSIVSSARPKIADYHFTTLSPNLGVVSFGEGSSFVMADIPGLVEGAHEGIGLGHEFLRHIERTRMIIHVIDMGGTEGRDPYDDFIKINNELVKYSEKLIGRKQVIAANKMDVTGAQELLSRFSEKIKNEGYNLEIFPISAATNKGIIELINKVGGMLEGIPIPQIIDESSENIVYKAEDEKLFTVRLDDSGVYNIEGNWIRKLFNSTNINDYESMQYFQRLLKSKGVIDELERMGIKEGDSVRIDNTEFDFVP